MTRALDTLVERTLVYRQRSIADHRVVQVELSDEGARIAAELDTPQSRCLKRPPDAVRNTAI